MLLTVSLSPSHHFQRREVVLSGVEGTGPPTGDRPRRSIAAGRAVACRRRRIGDCKIGGLTRAGTRAAAD